MGVAPPGEREFVLVKGRHPSSDPNHGQDDTGYDIQEEERDLHHQPGPGHVHERLNGGRNHHHSLWALLHPTTKFHKHTKRISKLITAVYKVV